jgi:hypothetical protein
MVEQIVSKLLEYGPMGLFAIYLLYRNRELNKKVSELENEKDSIQENRVEDVKDNYEVMNALVGTLKEFLVEVRGKLDAIKDELKEKN